MPHPVRVQQVDLKSVLEQQHPQIDLKLKVYEASTSNFLKAITSYKNRSIATISEKRKQQATDVKKLEEKIKAVEEDTNRCKIKEIELAAELEREQEERREADTAVAAFKRQLSLSHDKCSTYDSEIDQLRAILENLIRERDREETVLKKHSTGTSPEVTECERRLGCIIEGIQKDQLLIRFTQIDPENPRREFSAVMDFSGPIYKVPTHSPPLATLPILLESLNKTKDVYAFIHQLRQAFVKLAS